MGREGEEGARGGGERERECEHRSEKSAFFVAVFIIIITFVIFFCHWLIGVNKRGGRGGGEWKEGVEKDSASWY